MALFACVPNVALSLITAVFGFIYKISSLELAAVISGVANFFMRITMSMYNGIIQTAFGAFESVADSSFLGSAVVFMLVSALSIAVNHFSFTLGAREIKLFGFLSSGKKK
jgi:hypothetical protein